MPTFIDELKKELRPGFFFVIKSGHMWIVQHEDGSLARLPTGQPITLRDSPSYHYQRRIRQLLREARVLKTQRTRHTQHKKAVVKNTSNPVITAQKILQDPNSTARERGMAQAYLRLLDDHNKIMAVLEAVRQRQMQ